MTSNMTTSQASTRMTYTRILCDFIKYTNSLHDSAFHKCMVSLYTHIAATRKKVAAIGVRIEKMETEIDVSDAGRVCVIEAHLNNLETEFDTCTHLLEHVGVWTCFDLSDVHTIRQSGFSSKLMRRAKRNHASKPKQLQWLMFIEMEQMTVRRWWHQLMYIENGMSSYALLEFAQALMGTVPA